MKIFRSVSCLFKPDLLRQWEPEPVSVKVEADVRDPGARTVPVPLEGRSGQMMRCKFYFSDSWLLISEISFITGTGPTAICVCVRVCVRARVCVCT